MTGKSHVTTGVTSAVVLFDSYLLMSREPVGTLANNILVTVKEIVFDTNVPMFVFVPICILLYLLGLLLPDIDTPYSPLGRICYLPVQHRTWTHGILFCLLFVIPSIWLRMFLFLVLGCVIHLFFDSFSKSGVCWLYPIKFKIRIPVYHTHSMSEYIFVMVVVLFTIGYTLFTVQHIWHIFNLENLITF